MGRRGLQRKAENEVSRINRAHCILESNLWLFSQNTRDSLRENKVIARKNGLRERRVAERWQESIHGHVISRWGWKKVSECIYTFWYRVKAKSMNAHHQASSYSLYTNIGLLRRSAIIMNRLLLFSCLYRFSMIPRLQNYIWCLLQLLHPSVHSTLQSTAAEGLRQILSGQSPLPPFLNANIESALVWVFSLIS